MLSQYCIRDKRFLSFAVDKVEGASMVEGETSSTMVEDNSRLVEVVVVVT